MTAIPLLFAASHYTNGRSLLSPKKLIALAKTAGVAGICDDQALAGAYEFSLEAKKKGVKAVIGTRLLLGDLELAVHVEKPAGWSTLCRLSNELRLNSIDLPRLFKELASAPLFVSIEASCAAAKAWAAGSNEAIEQLIASVPKDNLAFAIARAVDGLQGRAVARKAADNGIPSIAAPIPVVAESVDIDIINILDDEQTPRWPVTHYLSDSEIRELYADLPGAVENAIALAARCNFALAQNKPSMPTFKGVDEQEALRQNSAAGLERRLSENAIVDRAAYDQRYAMEIEIIIKLGFAGYFLIVADFIKWAKENDIPVGPGRGSGAGSVVAWALTITDLDPLRLGLLFERFLNPERVSMPDFDIDFCETRRGEVIRYVQGKYGADHVAQIITFGKLKARAVLRDTGRILQMSYGQVDRLCKMVPNHPTDPWTLPRALNGVAEFRREYDTDEEVHRLIDLAVQLEGLPRNSSTHAAGVVIGD
ncbi:MAG: DNA polymerase III subunit alpha, partial [Hyphomicrobiales bacterium]|nr:DNA polymerase III subunit alpha [Hyphomicrobiales bacterium]